MKRFVQFFASLALTGLLLFAVLRHFDWRQTAALILQAQFNLVIFGVLLIICSYLVRSVRWRIWEQSLSFRDSLRLILIGFMGNNVLPLRRGELLRADCMAAKACNERGRTIALASISTERILDGLILSLFGLIVVSLVSFDRRLQWTLFFISLILAILTAGLALGNRFQKRIRSLVYAANRKFPGHVSAYATEKATQFLDGLVPLGTFPRFFVAFVATVVVWCIETGGYYCIGLAIWDDMTVKTALLTLVLVNLASLVPLTMGGIGTIEVVAPVFLLSSGVPQYPALAIVVLQHAAQYLFTTIAGGILFLRGGYFRIPFGRSVGVESRRAISAPPLPVIKQARSALAQFSSSVELKPPTRDEIQLSIVIPAYDEQARLPRTILETIRWCTSQNLNFELIIADDGSRDQTLALARLFEETDARVRTLACPHMGKGAAVRLGMLNAKGSFILFMDADGATPLDEIPRLLQALEKGHDVAIGSRVMQYPGEIDVKTPVHRRIIGRGFAFFVNLFAIGGIGDTQCGFKMFRREGAMAIFSRQKIAGFAFDVEILYIARRLSLSIAEIPVNWVAQPGSKVNLIRDSIGMLWDICHIRWLHRKCQISTSLTQSEQLFS